MLSVVEHDTHVGCLPNVVIRERQVFFTDFRLFNVISYHAFLQTNVAIFGVSQIAPNNR